jgi:hypothetical protein
MIRGKSARKERAFGVAVLGGDSVGRGASFRLDHHRGSRCHGATWLCSGRYLPGPTCLVSVSAYSKTFVLWKSCWIERAQLLCCCTDKSVRAHEFAPRKSTDHFKDFEISGWPLCAVRTQWIGRTVHIAGSWGTVLHSPHDSNSWLFPFYHCLCHPVSTCDPFRKH